MAHQYQQTGSLLGNAHADTVDLKRIELRADGR